MTCGTIYDMKVLKVGKLQCLLDDDDFEWMSRLTWKAHKGGYLQLSKFNLIHRIIAKAPKGMDVHHRNENKLDNRKENLELISPSEHQKYHIHRLVAFQKAHQRYPDKKPCANCGDSFEVNPRKRKRNKCCSLKCAMAMRIAGRKRQALESSLK